MSRVDSDEEAELRRLEGRDQGSQLHAGTSNELPTAEPPAEPAASTTPPLASASLGGGLALPAKAPAPAVVPAPGAPALEATEQEEVEDVQHGSAFDDDDEPFGSSLEIEQQLKDAQAKVDAAEARAAEAEDDAKKWMRATARAIAAEGRAGQAEALSAKYEAKLSTMCDLNDKLYKDIKLQTAKKLSSTDRCA